MIDFDLIRNKLACITVILSELEEAEISALVGDRCYLRFKERFVDFRLHVLKTMLKYERKH